MSGAFRARAERVDLSFPLCFGESGEAINGHCLNISESGLMASFDRAPELWTTGTLQLSYSGVLVRVQARVARCEERHAGLSFLFHDEGERQVIRTLVESAAAQSTLAGGRPPF